VKIQLGHRIVASRKIHYATNEDFCRLLTNDVKRLYLLSYLLTANHEKAEQCFAAGLEHCVDGLSVFQEWADAWARRVIIRDAVWLVQPRPSEPALRICALYTADENRPSGISCDAQFANVLALEDFERFVFVLSVLEGYPDHSCAILLGTSRQELRATRVRALDHMAGFCMEGSPSLVTAEGVTVHKSSTVEQCPVQQRSAVPWMR